LRSRLYERQQQNLQPPAGRARRTLIGSGDRSERIRTYNFPQNRLTDHRINLTLYRLDAVIAGELDEVIQTLRDFDKKQRLGRRRPSSSVGVVTFRAKREQETRPACAGSGVHPMSPEQPWTVGRLLKWTTEFLTRKGVESAPLDAALLLAHALGCKRLDLYTRYEEVPDDDKRQRYRELVRQRVEGCPTAYLLGRKEFFSLEFEVDRAVLIPATGHRMAGHGVPAPAKGREGPRLLDIGTGSGCLAVAAAVRHKTAQVTPSTSAETLWRWHSAMPTSTASPSACASCTAICSCRWRSANASISS